jgi:hypothetical protein
LVPTAAAKAQPLRISDLMGPDAEFGACVDDGGWMDCDRANAR